MMPIFSNKPKHRNEAVEEPCFKNTGDVTSAHIVDGGIGNVIGVDYAPGIAYSPPLLPHTLIQDTNELDDETDLREQTRRAGRERRYLEWLCNLRIGETSRFVDGDEQHVDPVTREMVTRLPHGFLHHFPTGQFFVSLDEVPMPTREEVNDG